MNLGLFDSLLCIAFLAFCLLGMWLTRRPPQS